MFEAGFLTSNTLDITYLLETYLNVTVTTDNLGLVIPEILTKYGSGKAVSLSGSFAGDTQTATSFTSKGQTVSGSLAVTVGVDTGATNETAISVEFDNFEGNAIINAVKGSIYGNIVQATAGTVSGFSTTLGITADDFLKEVQGEITHYVNEANTALAAGIVIPTVMGIDVSDLDLNFFDGYLEFGISVDAAFWNIVWDLAGLPRHSTDSMQAFEIEEPVMFL
jgi:hypothetical protein